MSPHAKIHYINFCRRLAVTSLFFFFPLHFLDLGFSGWQIGVIVSLFAFAPLAVSFPTGWMNDRFSIAGIVRAALLAEALLLLLIALARNFFLVAGLFLLLGAANNALDVSMNSLYFKDERGMDQNRKYGTYAFWLSLGPTVGILAGGLLMKVADFKVVPAAYAALLLLVLFSAGRFDPGRFRLVSFKDYRQSLFRPKTLLFVPFVFVLALHWGIEGTVYSPFLAATFAMDTFQIALYISTGFFFVAVSAFLVARLKFNAAADRRLLVLAMLLSGAGLILMVNSRWAVSLGFRILHEIGDGALAALTVLFISRLFDRETIGGSAGIVLSIQVLGQMLGALAFAPLGFHFGLQYPFFICGGLIVLNALYGATIFRRLEY